MKILCKIGIHKMKLVLSRYYTFETRKVTLECKHCGKLKWGIVPHHSIYPFPTTPNIEDSQYDELKDI